MKYLILGLQLFELFLLFGMFSGGEYPEGVLVPFVLLCGTFVAFLLLLLAHREHRKLVNVITIITLTGFLAWIIFVITKGYNYFGYNWSHFMEHEYKNMVVFLLVIILLQAIKLYLLNTKRKVDYKFLQQVDIGVRKKKFWIFSLIAVVAVIIITPFAGIFLFFVSISPQNPEDAFKDNRTHYETIITKVKQHTLTDQDKDHTKYYVVDEHDGVVRVAFSVGGVIDNWCAVIYDPTDLVLEANRYKFDIDLETQADPKSKAAVKLFGGDLISVQRIEGQWFKGCFS